MLGVVTAARPSRPGPRPRPLIAATLAAALVLLGIAGPARALPVRESTPSNSEPLLSTYSKYKTLLSLESQERLSRISENRVRGFAAILARALGEPRRLKRETIRVCAFVYGELVLARLVVGNNPINRRDPLGLQDAGITLDNTTNSWTIDATAGSRGPLSSVGPTTSRFNLNINEPTQDIEAAAQALAQSLSLGILTIANPPAGFATGTAVGLRDFNDVTANGDPDEPDYWEGAGLSAVGTLLSGLGLYESWPTRTGVPLLPPGLEGDPESVARYGHSCSRHGPGPKSLRNLTGRARGTGTPQGQWVDPHGIVEAAGTFPGATEPHVVPIAEGRGVVILPDGTVVPATRAVVVPRGPGLTRVTYPIQ